MTDSTRNEMLEIYKLHAELADRVSQRREGANRLYVSLLVGLTVFSAALLRYGAGDAPARIVLCAVGIVGALLAVSWFVVIRSYRQLATGKFRTLAELEKKLAYSFYTREWELLTADGWRALREGVHVRFVKTVRQRGRLVAPRSLRSGR